MVLKVVFDLASSCGTLACLFVSNVTFADAFKRLSGGQVSACQLTACIGCCSLNDWWARQDSNLQPDRYERPALTIELQALEVYGQGARQPSHTTPHLAPQPAKTAAGDEPAAVSFPGSYFVVRICIVRLSYGLMAKFVLPGTRTGSASRAKSQSSERVLRGSMISSTQNFSAVRNGDFILLSRSSIS